MSTTSLLSGGGSGRRNLPNQASFATTTTTTTTTTMNNYSGSRTIPVSLTPTTPRCACQRPSKETTMMALCMGVVILTSAGERASFKMMIDAMKPFRFFLTQLITLIYVPIMFAIVSYKKLRTPDIQPEMEEFSKCKFAFMALLDVVHLSIVTISGGIIPAPLTVLLLQSSVPATMFVSRYFLGHQYQWTHYTSSLMILIGLSIYMIPMVQSVTTNQVPSNRTHAVFSASASASAFSPSFSFSSSTPLSPSPSLPTTTVHAPTTELNVVYNCIIYFFCCVPGALSAIYKEYALQTQPMDMYYLNLWVTFFQFIILIPLAPIGFHYQSWSIQSNDSNWSDFRHLFENIGMGIDCWLKGNNPSADYRDGAVVIGAEYAQCEYALYLVLFYVACTLLFNVFVIRLMRRGASLMQLNVSFIVPIVLSYVVLYVYNDIIVSKSIDGSKIGFNGDLHWESMIGVVLVVVGVMVYRGAAKEPGTEYETEPGATPPPI